MRLPTVTLLYVSSHLLAFNLCEANALYEVSLCYFHSVTKAKYHYDLLFWLLSLLIYCRLCISSRFAAHQPGTDAQVYVKHATRIVVSLNW